MEGLGECTLCLVDGVRESGVMGDMCGLAAMGQEYVSDYYYIYTCVLNIEPL